MSFAPHDADRGRWRRHRLDEALLYVVAGTRAGRGGLETFLEAVLSAGADVIQLRDKEAEASSLLRAGAVFKAAAERHEALFIVNDRPDLALALDADGVHLGQDDLPPQVARRIIGPDALIGLSTHSLEQFASADVEADYLSAGPVFATPTKPGRPATGLDFVRGVAEYVSVGAHRRPWFAIGGLNADTLPGAIGAGARRAVVVRAVDTEEAGAAAATLRRRLDGTRGGSAA